MFSFGSGENRDSLSSLKIRIFCADPCWRGKIRMYNVAFEQNEYAQYNITFEIKEGNSKVKDMFLFIYDYVIGMS